MASAAWLVQSAGVATITLSNPGRANALSNATFRDELPQIVENIAADPNARAVVITGADGAFCAGSELDAEGFGDAAYDDTVDLLRGAHRIVTLLRGLRIPSIAAMDGVAIGAGLGLAAACDIRVASPRLRASVPHVLMGLTPDMGLTWLLPHVIGEAAARDLMLTGRMIRADEALALGLVTRVADDPLALAQEMAQTIASLPPGAVRSTRDLVAEASSHGVEESLFDGEPRAFADALHSPDFAARFAAYRRSLANRGKRPA